MQHLKNFNWKKFLLQGVLPCLLAVAVGFISRYQLELSDGVTESFLQLQWPLYAPLNALTAFCLTLILFALLGKVEPRQRAFRVRCSPSLHSSTTTPATCTARR